MFGLWMWPCVSVSGKTWMAFNWSICAIQKCFGYVLSALPWWWYLFNPPIEFGNKHSYRTRQSPWFVNIPCYKKCFSQRFFRYQATTWWNSLPSIFFNIFPAFMISYGHICWIWLDLCVILWVIIAFVLVMVRV